MHDAIRPLPSIVKDRRLRNRALALVPAGLLALLLMRPVWDVDIFWQLKLGEMILAHLGPIPTEPFAASHLGEPLPAITWLGQAVMAGVRLLGGWDLLRVFDAVCWLGGFWAVGAASQRKGAPFDAVMLALMLAVVAALPAASVRPQSLAALSFGLLLALRLLEPRLFATIALGVPLLVLWQNLHPSVSVGVVAMVASAVPGMLRWLRDRTAGIPATPLVLALIGCAAIFATPDGAWVLEVSARNAEASMAIGASEWRPLWILANHVNAVPILAVGLITALLVARHRKRFDAEEVAVAFVLLAMTLMAYRFVLFWAIAMVPVIARALRDRSSPGERSVVPHGAMAVSLVLVALLEPVILPTRFDRTLPMLAIQRLKQENVRGVIYADFPYGGPVIDAGFPDWSVAYDGRYYRYTPEEWQFNGSVEGGTLGLRDILRKWRVAAFLLKVSHNTPLAQELARTPGWKRIWDREGIVVYVPAGK